MQGTQTTREHRREIARDSYVGDITCLHTVARALSRKINAETFLCGCGSSVLWFAPFPQSEIGKKKKKNVNERVESMNASKDENEFLLASCAIALPDGARVHGIERAEALDASAENGFAFIVWGGRYVSVIVLFVPEDDVDVGNGEESDNGNDVRGGNDDGDFDDVGSSPSSRSTALTDARTKFGCEFLMNIGSFANWVHDCKICEPDVLDTYGHYSLAVVLSDNSCERWTVPWSVDVKSADCAPRCLAVSRCEAESLLYCACLRGNSWKQMQVCSGTAFGELLVWFCGRENNQGKYPIASLQGHAGGIMRCRYSKDGKFIVSASEDRTIRVFAIPEVTDFNNVFLKCVRASEVMFGHDARCWDCEPYSINKYGDGSLDIIATTCEDRNVRVFEAPTKKGGFQEIIINGKDNYTLDKFNINNINVTNEELAIATNGRGITGEDMKASMCFKGFRGKGAWRTCWMRDESKTLWLIVGGADGGIKMYDCRQLDRPATESSASLVVVAKEEENDKKKKKKKKESRSDELLFEDFEVLIPPDSGVAPDEIDLENPNYIKLKKDSERDDYATIVRLVENDNDDDDVISAVAGTNHGMLYLSRVSQKKNEKKCVHFEVLYTPKTRSKIVTVEFLNCNNEFIFGDSSGLIRTCRRSNGSSWQCPPHENLLFDFPVAKPRLLLQVFYRDGKLYTHEADGTLKRWNVSTNENELEMTLYENRRVVSLNVAFGFLFIGDQRGGVWVYDSTSFNKVAYEMSAHDNNAVTHADIRMINGIVQFISGGRDGVIRRWSIAAAVNGGVRLREDTKWTSPSKNASQFVIASNQENISDSEHITYVGGFRLTSFAMYSLVLDRELFNFNVGAWKTPHHFISTQKSKIAAFVHCAKAGIVTIKISKPELMASDLKTSENGGGAKSLHTWTHGREAHAVAIIPPAESDEISHDAAEETHSDCDFRMYKDSYNPLCLVTGSESGAIHRLSWDRYREIGARLYDASVVDTQGAGAAVKCISTVQKSRNKHIVVTGGAKNMLAAFVFEWVKHENDENENDWRISTKRLVSQKYVDYAQGRKWSKGVGFVEPKNISDKRIMDISVFIHEKDTIRCVTTGSDGEIAIIELDEVSRKFEKIHATCLNDKPVLSVSTVTITANKLMTFFATGSTDGTVAVWSSIDLSMPPLLTFKEAHQSGVNGISLNVFRTEDEYEGKSEVREDVLSLVTGGDDQKMTITIIRIVSVNEIEILARSEVTLAHESAIRSLWSNGTVIVSTGLDQRVHFWDISFVLNATDDGKNVGHLLITKNGTKRAETPEIECVAGYRRPRDGFIELAICGRGIQTFSSYARSDFEDAIFKFCDLSTKEWNEKYGPGFPNVAELILHVHERDKEGPKMDSQKARQFPDKLFREVDVKAEERENQKRYGNKYTRESEWRFD